MSDTVEKTRVWVTLWRVPDSGTVRAVASVAPLRKEGCDISRFIIDLPHDVGLGSGGPIEIELMGPFEEGDIDMDTLALVNGWVY
jgi:hypothetical protein